MYVHFFVGAYIYLGIFIYLAKTIVTSLKKLIIKSALSIKAKDQKLQNCKTLF